MAEYPSAQRQNKFFASRFLKLLIKEAIVPEISGDGFVFLTIIAHQEDDTHYRRPVRFWDEQIGDRLGCSRSKVQHLKRRLVQAGWLHHESRAKRKQGEYWVTIPPEYADSFEEIYYSGAGASDDTSEGVSCSTSETINDDKTIINRRISDDKRTNTRRLTDDLQTVTIKQLPVNNKSASNIRRTPRQEEKKKFEPEDLETAKQLLAAIREHHPKTTDSSLEDWARQIRLLRTKDKNTTDEIREVVAWLPKHAGRDEFAWGRVIRSGFKLRKHFPALHSAMGSGGSKSKLYQLWEGEARPEDDIAPF